MKKIFMFILLISLLFITSCITNNDGSIIYKNNKYLPCEDTSTIFVFKGPSHFVKKTMGALGIRMIYCLDSDYDESILFVYADYDERILSNIRSWFWFKDKQLVPDNDTTLTSVEIVKDSSWHDDRLFLNIDNECFNDIFISSNKPKYIEIINDIKICFTYNNIEYYDTIAIDIEDNIYVFRSIKLWDSDDDYYFSNTYYKLIDKYNLEMKNKINLLINNE